MILAKVWLEEGVSIRASTLVDILYSSHMWCDEWNIKYEHMIRWKE